MVFIPTGERQVATPGGAVLPPPSGARLNIAGSQARAVSQLGNTLADIGFKAQRANDNAELKTETINAEAKLKDELTRIKRDVQDPEQYEIQARKALDDLIKDSSNKIGRRNKVKFQNVLNQLQLSAGIAISKEGFGKIVDKSKAAHTLLKDTVIQDIATGKLSQVQGIAIVNQSTNELVSNGIFDQENKVAEDRGFGGRVAEVAFESKFPSDPEGAMKELNENKNISVEVKQNLIDKEIRKFNQIDKVKKEENRLSRIAREKDLRAKAKAGQLTEEQLNQDAIDNPDNPISADSHNSTLNQIYKIREEGGIGNPEEFNDMMRNIRRNPTQFSIEDIYAFEDENDLNEKQSQELESKWESLTTGRTDPNDITTFREYKQYQDRIKLLFAPDPRVVENEIDFFRKNLRYDEAYQFGDGRAQELLKQGKSVNEIISQTTIDTFNHMKQYDEAIAGLLEREVVSGESAIADIKQAVKSELAEQETELTEEQLDQIEAIFDKADKEGREPTEDEIAQINKIQGVE